MTNKSILLIFIVCISYVNAGVIIAQGEPRFGQDSAKVGASNGMPRQVLCRVINYLPYNKLGDFAQVCQAWYSAKQKFNTDNMNLFAETFPRVFALYSDDERKAVRNWQQELHLHYEAKEIIEQFEDEGEQPLLHQAIKSSHAPDLDSEMIEMLQSDIPEVVKTNLVVPLVRLLVAYGADVNVRDNLGLTPLHWACTLGNTAVVSLLVKRNDLDINMRFEHDQDNLFTKILQELGMVYEEPLIEGRALDLACSTGNFDIASMLITYGANVNSLSGNGEKTYRPAALILRWHYEHLDGKTCDGKCFDLLESLFNNGAKADLGYYNLIECTDDIKMLDLLLEKLKIRFNLNQLDENGKSVLHHAIYFKTRNQEGCGVCDDPFVELPKTMELLRKHRVDFDFRDGRGLTVLCTLSPNPYNYPPINTEFARLLVENGANVNAICGVKYQTPLHFVMENINWLYKNWKIYKEEQIEEQIKEALDSQLVVVRILLAGGAQLDRVNCDGLTPIDLVTDEKIKDILRVELEKQLQIKKELASNFQNFIHENQNEVQSFENKNEFGKRMRIENVEDNTSNKKNN